MIKSLIGGILIAVFVIGGAVSADMIKPVPGAASHAKASSGHGGGHGKGEESGKHPSGPPDSLKSAAAEKKDAHGKPAKGGHDSDGGHGGDHGEAPKSGTTYYKFSRQFIVPVVNGRNVQSLVILDLNLELDAALSEKAYEMEPKLRDRIMTELLGISSEQRFEATMTDPENLSVIRSRLLSASRSVLSDGVHDVLILDIARQDTL